ncbi:MAG: C2 family cysteine protease [Cyanobacteria bacterium P01_E01_bin.42]
MTNIFGDDKKASKLIDDWIKFCGINKLEDLINELISSNEQGVTLEDIEPLLQQQTFADSIMKWLKSNHIFPEKKSSHSESSDVKFTTSVPWDKIALSQYKAVKKNTPDNYSSLGLLMEIFQNNTKKIDAWIEFVQKQKIEEKIVNALAGHIEKAKKVESESLTVTLSDIENFFKGQIFTKDIMTWIEKQKIFPGKLGTGIYSKVQIEMFDQIEVALSANKPVTISANVTLIENDEKAEGAGAGGEQKFAGLAGRHAYSVLETKKTQSPNPEDKESGEFRWVKIRNPWGHYSRKYINDEIEGLKAITNKADTGKGISWIELSDATKYFALASAGDK